MSAHTSVTAEMRLYSPEGEPLYLNAAERARFMGAVRKDTNRDAVIFCTLLHYTGARPTELRHLTSNLVDIDECSIRLRTIKKRKRDNKGKKKEAEYRTIPIPRQVMDSVAIAFDLRAVQKKNKPVLLWPSPLSPSQPVNASTVYRWTKQNMIAAGLAGKNATAKGLRHGFAAAMVLADKPVPLVVLRDLMGHSSSTVTEIYLQLMGGEKRECVLAVWNEQIETEETSPED